MPTTRPDLKAGTGVATPTDACQNSAATPGPPRRQRDIFPLRGCLEPSASLAEATLLCRTTRRRLARRSARQQMAYDAAVALDELALGREAVTGAPVPKPTAAMTSVLQHMFPRWRPWVSRRRTLLAREPSKSSAGPQRTRAYLPRWEALISDSCHFLRLALSPFPLM